VSNEHERPEPYITAREVAERVNLSADTVLRYWRDGRIPGRRLPGTIRPVRFLWSEVEAAWRDGVQMTIDDVAA
jgi:excisionase family DNA binding protein